MPAAALIPRRRRARACATIAVAVAVLAWLGAHYAHHTQAGGFDSAVDGWFTTHVNGRAALWVADLGNPPVVVVLTALLVGACAAWRTARGVALAVLAPVIAGCLTEYVLKPWVHRTKFGFYAYPSGHTTGLCAVAFTLVLVALGPARRQVAAPRATVTVALLAALACGLGLIASDYHYATDVIGGACLSLACVLTIALLVDAVFDAAVRS
jgi:undecaprenyl-diphosphatase